MQNLSLVLRISRIPTKRNIHWHCPQQKLRNMDKTNGDAHQQLLPWLRRDSKGTLKEPTPRHPINKTKSIWESHRKQDNQDQDQGQKITFPSHPTHQNPGSFLPHRGPLWLDSHWPDGGLPIYFPTRQRYIMVAIHLDANYIFVEPMSSRSKKEMIRALEKIINRMRMAGLRLKKHTLDNKASEAFKQCIQEQ